MQIYGGLTGEGPFKTLPWQPVKGEAIHFKSDAPDSSVVVNPTTNTVYTVTGTDANGCSNSSTITQSVSLCTGITQLVNESSVSVFPNPFTDVITIKNTFKNSTIVIVDVLGKVVFEKQIVSSETSIDLSELKTGFYQLMVNGESNSYTQKIIKQ